MFFTSLKAGMKLVTFQFNVHVLTSLKVKVVAFFLWKLRIFIDTRLSPRSNSAPVFHSQCKYELKWQNTYGCLEKKWTVKTYTRFILVTSPFMQSAIIQE